VAAALSSTRPTPRAHDFLVIAELDGERRDARIFMAAAYDRETLMEQFSHRVAMAGSVVWDDQRQAVAAERRLDPGR
jgi:ATP-dependent helicase HrpB